MREARERARLSQLEVAAELGVTKGSLSAWENDKNFPQLQTFVQLCKLYRASADAILFPGDGAAPARPEHAISKLSPILLRRLESLTERQVEGLQQLLQID